MQAEQEFYISQCKFPDVPAWARLYVGYCYFNSLMVGYDTGAFGADDGVTPAAACTVVLRYMDLPAVSYTHLDVYKRQLQGKLERLANVSSATFVDRQAAMDQYVERYADSENKDLFEDLPENTLRHRYRIHVVEIEKMGETRCV